MSGSLALDSNAVIAYRAGNPQAASVIEAADHLLLPLPALGELLFGAKASGRVRANLAAVHAFAENCSILHPDQATAEAYSDIRVSLKRRGKPLPENDLWIAALSL